MMELRTAVYVDGVRIPIGRAKADGYYGRTRADDMAVRCIRALLERHPGLDTRLVDDNVWAATAQVGDQGLTMGRATAVLAGLPTSVPGYAVDRMCAGSLTSVTNAANAIRVGAQRLVIAGGVEHMGRHPMAAHVDPNPRFLSEELVDPSALVMGNTAENLHDMAPDITRERADAYALQSQERCAKAIADGAFATHVVPMTVWSRGGWRVVATDEPPRPGTTMDTLRRLPPAFRPGGRVTAGNSAGLNDGAGCVLLADAGLAREHDLPAIMRLVDYAFVGVEPETMGWGPIPATERLLAKTGLSMEDIDAVEMNEAFAVQCVAFLDHFGIAMDSTKVNPFGGAIALGHPLAMSGARLTQQLAHRMQHEDLRYGITTLCVGFGMGCTVLWERV